MIMTRLIMRDGNRGIPNIDDETTSRPHTLVSLHESTTPHRYKYRRALQTPMSKPHGKGWTTFPRTFGNGAYRDLPHMPKRVTRELIAELMPPPNVFEGENAHDDLEATIEVIDELAHYATRDR